MLKRALLGGLALSLLAAPALAAPDGWSTSWASAQMTPTGDNALPATDQSDVTVRQIIHISQGGSKLRIRVSNAMGSTPLRLRDVHVALGRLGSAAIDSDTDQAVHFGGNNEVLIPAFGDYISDPVDINVPDGASLAVSFYLPGPVAQQTGHPGSRTTTFIVHGDHSDEADLPNAEKRVNWFNLSGVDVRNDDATIVALGDSITDGHGVETDSDGRWTDVLAGRLKDKDIAVVNEGIGGNRLHLDGLGPSAISRFDRDVLSISGAKWVIVLEGVNDLGVATREASLPPEVHDALVGQIISDYQQLIYRAHAHGLKIYGATIMPFTGNDYYHPDALVEADRQKINSWIRHSGAFDSVIDFDAVVRDPKAPDHLLPALDSGDHLHPNMAGYKAMGDAIDTKLFTP